MLDSALRSVCLAICFHRLNHVIVDCLGLETVYPYPEAGMGMVWIQPDWRARRLTEVLGVRSVADDPEMQGRPTGVVALPPDNRKIGLSPFDLRPSGDLDARDLLGRRTRLSGRRARVKQATDRGRHRQYQKESGHKQTRWLSTEWVDRVRARRRRSRWHRAEVVESGSGAHYPESRPNHRSCK